MNLHRDSRVVYITTNFLYVPTPAEPLICQYINISYFDLSITHKSTGSTKLPNRAKRNVGNEKNNEQARIARSYNRATTRAPKSHNRSALKSKTSLPDRCLFRKELSVVRRSVNLQTEQAVDQYKRGKIRTLK